LAGILKNEFGIEDIILTPSSGGAFDVVLNGQTVFSKRREGRFPKAGEVESKVADLLGR
jgi:selT/selW/selH-like putative selenoprotein